MRLRWRNCSPTDVFLVYGALFVVVRLSLDDGHGAVELFDEDESDHLVGEGHAGEGDFVVGALVNLL